MISIEKNNKAAAAGQAKMRIARIALDHIEYVGVSEQGNAHTQKRNEEADTERVHKLYVYNMEPNKNV